MLCGSCISDSMAEILLSGRIYGSFDDSVIDNPPKVAEYILNCRQMGIRLLPPDINKGESAFSVEENESTEKTGEEAFKYNKSIRYGLSAIKVSENR